MYIGLRYPEDRKKRKRRKHSRAKTADSGPSSDATAKQCEHGARSHVRSPYILIVVTYLFCIGVRSRTCSDCNVRFTLYVLHCLSHILIYFNYKRLPFAINMFLGYVLTQY